MDDILKNSPNEAEHSQHMLTICQLLEQFQIQVFPQKM